MIRISLMLVLFFWIPDNPGAPEEHKERISKTFTFEDASNQNTLIIKNIQGSILIEGHNSTQVVLDLDKKIKADSKTDLEEGIQDISLGVVDTGDSVILYANSPYATLERKNGKVRYHWNNYSVDIDYEFNFDYSVKVPFGTVVDVSTVNKGDVKVVDTRAMVKAGNVNGSVYLEKITAVTKATTVNGVVECEITEKPTKDCSFNTINGDIKVSFPSNLSADISYTTMHGDFYTDFDINVLPSKIEKTKEDSESGTTYKVEKYPKFRVGDGDISIWFKTLNGDMILRMAK